jgi:hypothetical protein
MSGRVKQRLIDLRNAAPSFGSRLRFALSFLVRHVVNAIFFDSRGYAKIFNKENTNTHMISIN